MDKMVYGVQQTERKLQPFNVWKAGKIIFFARTLDEAIAALNAK